MAGTDSSQVFEFAPTPAVILCEPQLGENIGTAARAMANFGLWDLRIVTPRDGWPNPRAAAAAASAGHVIERARVFAHVEDAVADLSLVFATTARKRDMVKLVCGPEEAVAQMHGRIANGQGAGLLFGRERWGLNNEEVALCDAIVTLPVEAAFASLNIAQAVLVLAYEWRKAAGKTELLFETPDNPPAAKQHLVGFYAHLESELDRSGFLRPPEKRASMVTNLRAMFARGQYSEQEVRTLRGIVSSLVRHHERKKRGGNSDSA